ncbi:MAG: hypothetical protein AAGI89_04610 [Pseudomonadota bacterium]
MTAEAAPMTILNQQDLEARLDAAATVSETMRVLQKSGSNVVAEILDTVEGFTVWEHLPDGDVYDRESHGQYYYHAHPRDAAAPSIHDDEHGHFHTFLRGPGMGDARPDPSNSEVPEKPADIAAHLIGIGMDAMGTPIRLFTTNRWVTGEVWYSAEDVIGFLDRFEIDSTKPSWSLNLWITAIVQLYRPQIAGLLRQRDAAVAAWRDAHPESDVYEDRALEVTSSLEIDLAADVEALMAQAQ